MPDRGGATGQRINQGSLEVTLIEHARQLNTVEETTDLCICHEIREIEIGKEALTAFQTTGYGLQAPVPITFISESHNCVIGKLLLYENS